MAQTDSMDMTHPGQVIFETVASGETRTRPVEEIPEAQRFAFFREGVLVDDPAEADEAVPILRVRMLAVDAEGALVPTAEAVEVRILQYGPKDRMLRSTLMLRN